MKNCFALLAFLAFALPSSAQRTWIVDDDGGAGTDFLEIQPAFHAADPGDVILIRAGDYAAPVVLTQGLRVIAESMVELQLPPALSFEASFQITRLPAGQLAAVAGLDREDFAVVACQGTVILDGHLERGLDGVSPVVGGLGPSLTSVLHSRDVRIRGHRLAQVEDSHVEWVQGRDLTGGSLRVGDHAEVHVVGARLLGADGADPSCFFCLGGDGLPGLESRDSTVMLLSSEVQGGSGGVSSAGPSYDGLAAAAASLCGGSLRTSAVEATGGIQGGWFELPAYDVGCGASHTEIEPRLDPTLRMGGDPSPGGLLTIRVDGTPGDNIRLLLGRGVVRKPVPGSPVDQRVRPDRLSALGPIPASGRMDLQVPVPAHWAPGTLLHLQASAVMPNGQALMTNSIPLLVR